MLKTREQVKKHFPHGIEKLEIGSGSNPEPGYVHLDIQSGLPHLDILSDVRKTPLPSNFVSDHIRAVHIMEHFCHPEDSSPSMRKQWGTTYEVVKEMYRILKPGGKFLIVTPDYDKITASNFWGRVDKYWLQRWTVGGHRDNYDVHHWLWTHEDALKWFTQAGFKNVQDCNPVQGWKARMKLKWRTPAVSGNMEWHKIEWYHWLFIEGTK
jgi:predicted SAM-dependent methyltransferase